jgi:hypothetical protein
MNPKTLVKFSNAIGLISILFLVYWVFIYTLIQVFGFKVFRENMTQSFELSILGILALMAGALMINIMFNLTRIAERQQEASQNTSFLSKKWTFLFAFSFPFLFTLLFLGDRLSTQKRQRVLLQAAESILADNPGIDKHALNYQFEKNWLDKTNDLLAICTKMDQNLPEIKVLVKDQIGNAPIFLWIDGRYIGSDSLDVQKTEYLEETSKAERDYLKKVFASKTFNDTRFSAHDGEYELFYPVHRAGKTVVFYFSEFQRYGKLGN